MSKRKRTDAESLAYYMRKLEEVQRRHEKESLRSAPGVNVEENLTTTEDAPNDIPRDAPMPTAEASTPSQEVSTSAELDPELLIALGDETDNTPRFGDKIHDKLAERWEPILKDGLSEEAKDRLFKDYLVPKNCTLLQAPKLNSEILEAISEKCRNTDKKLEAEQQQLGVGVSAINKALTIMLKSDNKTEKLEAISIMSDGCRILSDLHYLETNLRMRLIYGDLYQSPKPFPNVLQGCKRDETLFGNKLGEKIKASKTIEKQGMSTSLTRSKNQKWAGPSRLYQNRERYREPDWEVHTMSRRPPPQQPSSSRSPVMRP